MKEFYTRFFLINTNEYPNLGADLWINKVLFILLPIVVLIFIGYHLVRNNTFLIVKRLAKRNAMGEDSAKTLKDLGLADRKILRLMLSGDGQITRLVKRKGAPEYTYEEYVAAQKRRKKGSSDTKEDGSCPCKNKIDFDTAEFYLDGTQSDRIAKICEKYEVRPRDTVIMCVAIVVGFIIVMLLMHEILTALDWLVGAFKESVESSGLK
ncbi:MAG: hypothetical protein IKV43_06200 [Clostridia bacterium]|nr:hypothetical protein [Clostridia bacterium]